MRRADHPQGGPGGHPDAHRGGVLGHLPPAAPGTPEPAFRHPRRPGGLRQRPVCGHGFAEERQYRRGPGAAHVPGHGHRHRHGQEGRERLGGGRRRGGHFPGRRRHVRHRQSALFAIGALVHVRGEEHRQQPAGPDRALRGEGRRLQVPVHRQGRRLGQQVVPVPGDPGDPRPGQPDDVPRRQGEALGDGGLPALSPGRGDRRNERRVHSQDGEARLHPLPGPPPPAGQRGGPGLPRPGTRGANPRHDPECGHRRPVRRQVLLP